MNLPNITDNIFSSKHTHELYFVRKDTGEVYLDYLPKFNSGSYNQCKDWQFTLEQLYPEFYIMIQKISEPK